MSNLPNNTKNTRSPSFRRKRESINRDDPEPKTLDPRLRGGDAGVIGLSAQSNAETIAAYNHRVNDNGLWNAGPNLRVSDS